MTLLEKIADPERRSVEFVSNGLTGCHVEDVLEEHLSSFVNSKKQVIILTLAGKPVYSYGRNEDDLPSLVIPALSDVDITGIIQAIDANFTVMGETLK